ncbi:DHA2 family efflux MFS transporter permease subunit [Luteimonas sp. RD2P54]|uniref:DHA2 family efflux MFS transporter permease subunit n=1 Tax=Luteimonas endophytica TaxID=3042023 RepID=A0ABT6J7Q0_9GAMM|nr:DHA2 family efflux MFS transporter permease subunit [Luteimonas endophytica]MDH5822854.1 DHA2 family efflux MFS transporter permease subunit [Luteimonas endophytica]
MPPSAPPPIPGRVWALAAVTGAGAFMAMLDSTVANLALDAIGRDFDATLPHIQWVVTGYLVALAMSLPAQGFLAARFGAGRLWYASTVAFALASILCALAPGPAWLVGGRVLQGLAGGLMVPAGQTVIAQAVDRRQLGRLMGVLGLVVALGPALGPALGGALLEVGSWRWLFWINVPVAAVALALAPGRVPPGAAGTDRRLDVAGLLLAGLGLPLLLLGAVEAGASGPDPAALLGGSAGLALLGAFAWRSLRRPRPLIDLGLLRGPVFARATLVAGLTGANMYAGLLLLPLYMLASGLDVGAVGLLLLAMGLGSALALPVAGTLVDRHGAGPVVLAGAGLLVASTLALFLPVGGDWRWLALVLGLRGVGLAWAQMPAMTAAYGATATPRMGDATTLVNVVQRAGGALGATAVVVAMARGGEGGLGWALGVLAVLSALPLLPGSGIAPRRQAGTSQAPGV